MGFGTIKIMQPWERIIFVMDMVYVACLYKNRVSKTYCIVNKVDFVFLYHKTVHVLDQRAYMYLTQIRVPSESYTKG